MNIGPIYIYNPNMAVIDIIPIEASLHMANTQPKTGIYVRTDKWNQGDTSSLKVMAALYVALLYLRNHGVIVVSPKDYLSSALETRGSSASAGDTQRSVWDIVWSCVITIFTCTWVSVHPNIPASDDTSLRIALRRLELMLWAIITPEMVIYWALRQWLGVRKLRGIYQGTMTHRITKINLITIFDCRFTIQTMGGL